MKSCKTDLSIAADEKRIFFMETERLILNVPSDHDQPHILQLRTNPAVMKYIKTGTIQNENQVNTFIARTKLYYKTHGIALCSVFEKKTMSFVGQSGLYHYNMDTSSTDIEMVCCLQPAYWRKAYATELATALSQWAFKNLKIKKLYATANIENQASRHVLEKIGMHYVNEILRYGQPVILYALTRNERYAHS